MIIRKYWKLGKLVTPKNKRNNINELSLYEKLLLQNRIKIEHTIGKYKQYKRIYLRYDRYIKLYESFLHLTSLMIFIRKTSMYLDK
jgi:hypothetical protein